MNSTIKTFGESKDLNLKSISQKYFYSKNNSDVKSFGNDLLDVRWKETSIESTKNKVKHKNSSETREDYLDENQDNSEKDQINQTIVQDNRRLDQDNRSIDQDNHTIVQDNRNIIKDNRSNATPGILISVNEDLNHPNGIDFENTFRKRLKVIEHQKGQPQDKTFRAMEKIEIGRIQEEFENSRTKDEIESLKTANKIENSRIKETVRTKDEFETLGIKKYLRSKDEIENSRTRDEVENSRTKNVIRASVIKEASSKDEIEYSRRNGGLENSKIVFQNIKLFLNYSNVHPFFPLLSPLETSRQIGVAVTSIFSSIMFAIVRYFIRTILGYMFSFVGQWVSSSAGNIFSSSRPGT